MSDFWLGAINLKHLKKIDVAKKIDLAMPAAQHPRRCQDSCMPKDEKKGTDPLLIKISIKLGRGKS